jgi:hypothetical protein
MVINLLELVMEISKFERARELAAKLEVSLLIESFFTDAFLTGEAKLKSYAKWSHKVYKMLPFRAMLNGKHKLTSEQYLVIKPNFTELEKKAITAHWEN